MFNVIVVVFMVETLSTLVVFYVLAVFCFGFFCLFLPQSNDHTVMIFCLCTFEYFPMTDCTHEDVYS